MSESDAGELHVLCRFDEMYWLDRDEDRTPPLAHYLQAFPGHEELIARAFIEIERAKESEVTSRHSPTPTSSTPITSAGITAPGNSLGPYRLVRELGRGGQAVVWLADDMRLGRKTALKILKPIGLRPEATLERFRREAAVTAKLDHPGICTVHEVGSDGVPWIAMQFIEGQTLAEIMANRKRNDARRHLGPRRSTRRDTTSDNFEKTTDADHDFHLTDSSKTEGINNLLELVEKVARALHAAHEAGVVHRDIKPSNIMISPSGDPIILDFGIAATSDDGAATLTMSDRRSCRRPCPRRDALRNPDRRSPLHGLDSSRVDSLDRRRLADQASSPSSTRGLDGNETISIACSSLSRLRSRGTQTTSATRRRSPARSTPRTNEKKQLRCRKNSSRS